MRIEQRAVAENNELVREDNSDQQSIGSSVSSAAAAQMPNIVDAPLPNQPIPLPHQFAPLPN